MISIVGACVHVCVRSVNRSRCMRYAFTIKWYHISCMLHRYLLCMCFCIRKFVRLLCASVWVSFVWFIFLFFCIEDTFFSLPPPPKKNRCCSFVNIVLFCIAIVLYVQLSIFFWPLPIFGHFTLCTVLLRLGNIHMHILCLYELRMYVVRVTLSRKTL